MKKNKYSKIAFFIALTNIFIALVNITIHQNISFGESVKSAYRYATQQTANTSAGSDDNSATAIDKNGNTVVVWANDTSLNSDIYYRRFDNKGSALETQEVLVNTTTTGNQVTPGVAMDRDGNFVVAWAGNGSGDSNGIYIQVYKADGTKIDSETLVNSNIAGNQTLPAISLDYDGGAPSSGNKKRLAVAWTSVDPTYNEDIYYQLYDVDFSVGSNALDAINTNQRVNSHQDGSQSNPSIAMNTFGEFVITWEGEGIHQGNTMTNQIWMQPYDHDGTDMQSSSARGPNVRINSNNQDFSQKPQIAADKSDNTLTGGNYIITFEGGPAVGSTDIFARRIGRAETGVCALNAVELEVNSGKTGVQDSPKISADFLGNFTITWHDADRANGDVYAQSYIYTGARNGNEFHVNLNTSQPDDTDQKNPAIAMNTDGFYLITFTDADGYDIRIQNYVSDLYKLTDTNLVNTQATIPNLQKEVDIALSPNNLAAIVWNEDDNKIKYSLFDLNNLESGPLIGDQEVASSATAVGKPSVSFFKDTNGSNTGRFIVSFTANEPTPHDPAENHAGSDIWYREFNADGSAAGTSHRVNIDETGNQTQADIAAGYYNQNGGAVEDYFTVIYKNTISTSTNIMASFHSDSGGFTEKQLEPQNPSSPPTYCAADCNHAAVSLDETNNQAVYTYNSSPTEVVGQTTVYTGSAINIISAHSISGDNNVFNDWSKSAILPSNQLLVTYSKYNNDSAPTASQVIVKRYSFNDLSTVIDTITLGTANESYYALSDVAADPGSIDPQNPEHAGDFLVTWTDFPANPDFNNILGQFYGNLGTSAGGLTKFGPQFKLNSAQNGNRLNPSIAMNTLGNVGATWEGNYEKNPGGPADSGDDSQGAIGEILINPLFSSSEISFTPICTQQIESGGRFIEVPDSVMFPAATIHPAASNSVSIGLRHNTLPDPDPIQYIQVTDLQGDSQPYTVSVAATNFSHNDGIHSLSVSNLEVKNCDAETVPDPSCIDMVEGRAGDFSLNESTNAYTSFGSETQQLTLADGLGNEIGRWKFYPSFKLTIPPIPPITIPGSYTSVITFTLL